MKSNCRKKNRGQGIVSVIVAAGVGAIVLGFLTDMLVKQGISQKFISQKLEMNDLTGNLMTTFAKANNCTCQFSSDATINPNSANYAANLKFDSGAPEGTQVIDVKKLYAGCRVGAQMPLLIAEEGQPLPGSSSLRVDKVQFINLVRTGGGINEWQGQWSISFQVGANSAIRSVRPILVTQKVTVNPLDIPNTRITACSGLSTGSGTLNFLAKWSPISGVLEDSNVFENAATRNIGVGTAAPDSKLHIKQMIDTVFGGLQITNVAGGPGTGANTSIFLDATNRTHIGGTYSSPDAIVIDNATGNVGIGSTNPTSGLEIYGSDLTYTKGTITIGYNGQVAKSRFGAGFGAGGATAISSNLGYDAANNLLLDNTARPGWSFLVGEPGDSVSIFRFPPQANPIGSTPGPFVVVNDVGNVGIGKTDPKYKLYVVGYEAYFDYGGPLPPSGKGGGLRVGHNANAGFIDVNNYYETGANYYSRNGGVSGIRFDWNTNIADGTYAGDITFYNAPPGVAGAATPGAEVLKIKQNGNVGIGTSDPRTKLQIDTPNDTTSIAAGVSGKRVAIGTYGNLATVAGWEPVTGVHNDLSIRAWSGTQLYLKNDGKVGIGTTNPASSLEVNGSIRFGTDGFASGGGLLKSDTAGNWLGNRTVLSVADGAGGVNDEVWIGPNTGGAAGHIQLVASHIFSHVVIDQSSDLRNKENIQTVPDALEKILSLRGVFYTWKDRRRGDRKEIGLIAQEVEAQYPEAVSEDGKGFKYLNYSGLIGPLIEAVKEFYTKWFEDSQEQNKKIDELKAIVEKQQKQIERLTAEVCSISKSSSICL